MKQVLEKIMLSVQKGSNVDDAIQNELGIDVTPIRAKVHAYQEDCRLLQQKYDGWKASDAIIQEVKERTANDRSKQFLWMSDIKKQFNLRNLRSAKEELLEQGADIGFMWESIEKAHAEEQRMASEVTEEELEALKAELADVTPDDEKSIRQVLLRDLEPEQAEALRKALEEAENLTKEQEDYAVIVASVILSGNDSVSEDEAVAAAVLHTASIFKGAMEILSITIPAMLLDAALMLACSFGAEIVGISLLSGVLFVSSCASFYVAACLSALSFGAIAYTGILRCIPFLKKVQKKIQPYVARAVTKARNAVLGLFGVIAEKVFRPAIYWVNNSMLPFINQKIVYPLKRRLKGLLNWFGHKKDQLFQFIQEAKSNKTHSQGDNWNAEDNSTQLIFDYQNEDESNWTLA